MTQEQEKILLKDLCARLPYGVRLNCCEIVSEPLTRISYKGLVNDDYDIDEVKPYLFPLSSMTDEQKEFIKNKFCYDWDIDDHPDSLWAHCIDIGDIDELIDWFHKNHFDYRGLIPVGLAIDATGKNIY